MLAALSELPREVRQALVSWNHATDYELPSYSTYAGGKGSGLFEKTYDLGACARNAVRSALRPVVRCHKAGCAKVHARTWPLDSPTICARGCLHSARQF